MKTGEIDLSVFRKTYFEEASEHVATIEAGLLELETNPGDHELLNAVFRAAHSIKGGSGMFALERVQRFTHALESLLDPLREGRLELTSALANLLFRATDLLKALLVEAESGQAEQLQVEGTIAELEQARRPASEDQSPAVEPQSGEVDPGEQCYEVVFKPGRGLFQSAIDPVLIVRNLCELGRVEALTLDCSELPVLSELDPECCYLSWSLRLRSTKTELDLRDVFAFVEDASEISIRRAKPSQAESGSAVAVGRPESARAAEPTAPPAEPTAIPADAEARVRSAGREPAASSHSTVRVSTEKLDRLLNLVGEIVIAQSMIMQALNHPAADTLDRVRDAVTDMERNTRELQERVMSVRLVPVSSVFNRFPRLVRDLSRQCGKEVELQIAGQETEIDKGVIEQLADPLTHLIRNALDHGLETADERRAAGKPPTGTVRLQAAHQGSSVVIEVSDDGRGLDTARLREKGCARGLIRADDPLSDEQIHALIFEPGFSTAERVTDVSGRGVGMDVVRRNLESVNGSVLVFSEPGRGVRFRLKLPLTMAILDGLALRVGTQTFVIPLLSITESFRPTREQLGSIFERGEVVRVRGEPIPLVRLYEALQIEAEKTDPLRATVVIVESGDEKIGLLVDELLGQAQFVIKSLEANYRRVEGAMGATILGDGQVALILDVDTFVRRGKATDGGAAGSDARLLPMAHTSGC